MMQMFRGDPTHDHQGLWVYAGSRESCPPKLFLHRLRRPTKATWIPLILHYKWVKHYGENSRV